MFLKKFIYVNWGNIPSLEFEFGPVNLFSGGNGSGKTTAADAIQTIMTAAHENLFQYNPGQDETTQRGRGGKRVRTAASYVLGCDDGSYSRTAPTDGYLAAIFHPSKGEKGEPFTAIIAIRARIESTGNHKNARQDQIQFFIVPEKQLTLEHFVRKDGAGRTVVQLPSLYGLLVQEYGKKGVEKYENKKPYLRRLYAALRGRNDSVTELEAVSAARAFSRFMAYKPVQSINRFVAEEILEAKDLGDAVRDISSQLKTIHGMERDAHQLKESIGLLGKTRDSSASYIDQWIELNVYDYMLARSEYHQTQAKYQKNKANQKQQKAQQQEKEQAVDDLKHKEEVLRDQLVSLEAQRRGIDALRQKDELEQNKSTLENQLQQHAGGLLEEDRSLQNNLQASEEISALCDNHSLLADWVGNDLRRFQHLNQQVLDSRKHMLQDIHHVLQKDFDHNASAIENGMDAYRAVANVHNDWYEFWHQAHEAVTHKDQLALILQQRRNRQQTLADQRKQKQQEITRLENHQVTYPAFVERALKAISAACPQADPRVLCDHIEVKDAQWQA
ncbi:MAG: hypothetical protein OEZ58_18430, partial [Gammaproteobacteria bacterium]|nr:hypothetical protein [Gammaproteobacteria bacterium]